MSTIECNNIGIFAEHNNGKLNSCFAELVGKAKDISKCYGDNVKVSAFILGFDVDDIVNQVKPTGVGDCQDS